MAFFCTRDFEPQPMHGHIYKLNEHGQFIAYEYRQGDLDAKFSQINPSFFQDMATYLAKHELADLIGLEVLDRPQDRNAYEFLLGDQGTIMVNGKDVTGGRPTRNTSWTYKVVNGGPVDKGDYSKHSARSDVDTHQCFMDGKPLPNIPSYEALVSILRHNGIID
ncbi:hypothetical protein GGR56DRAFT_320583 [Xylariaceae sp. FL0804]|nr:hypothetical protein GGR56DRAFT_320583 [Xylariaceae sp. FL0804]